MHPSFRYTRHAHILSYLQQPLTRSSILKISYNLLQVDYPHEPRWEVIVLVRDSARSTLDFDPRQCRDSFIHIDNLLVEIIEGCAIYNRANGEDAWTNHEATFNTTPFDETIDVVCTGTDNKNVHI